MYNIKKTFIEFEKVSVVFEQLSTRSIEIFVPQE